MMRLVRRVELWLLGFRLGRRVELWLLGPLTPEVQDLRVLAYGAGDQRQQRLFELVEWRVQRTMTVARGLVGSAASFATALFLSAFKDELRIDSVVLLLALVAAGGTGIFGVALFRQLSTLNDSYTALLAALRDQ